MTKEDIEEKLKTAFAEDIEKFDRQEMLEFFESLEKIGLEKLISMSEVY